MAGLLKLTSRFLTLPSRVVTRLRRIGDLLEQTALSNGHGGYSATSAESNARAHRMHADSLGLPPTPGPWGFLTSGYFFGLFLMAFVLNRIQNLIVPPRGPTYRTHGGRAFRRRRSMPAMLWSSIFPVDLSSTFARLVFRIPSIYLLGKALLLWTVVLLQSSELLPSYQWNWLKLMHEWAAAKEMEEICWFTFTSVCAALFVGGLTGSLDGLNSTSNAPFNLFGYAFMLYLYSSPITHVQEFPGGAARPDKHVMITVVLPLFQLTMTHCLEVRQRWARLRLVPTAICGILSLLHFHVVVWLSPSSYPLPHFVPSIVESFLAAVTLITCSLNALAQVLLTGTISKPLFGHTASLMPKWDEDFSVVLFRLGTGSLEATNVAGLGNEVGRILNAKLDDSKTRGTVEIDRSGVTSVSPGVEQSGGRNRPKKGFTNEIGTVHATSTRSDFWIESVINIAWQRELKGFLVEVWRTLTGTYRLAWAYVKGRTVPSTMPPAGIEINLGQVTEADFDPVNDPDVYNRFLRGETLSSDDEEFEPPSRPDSPHGTSSSATEDEGPDEDPPETAGLYADLSATAPTSTAAPLLLAHLTDTSPSPLTRRRYTRLVSGSRAQSPSFDMDEWGQFVREREEAQRASANRRRDDDDAAVSRMNCVVCTVEPREIICWPCRCLALCDDCRENLASRSSASKHTCPCCRRNVEGYSKIYIP